MLPHALVGRLVVLSLPVAVACAQCASQWVDGSGVPGTDGSVHAMTNWDPDGAGPEPARLVIGGRFRLAGDTPAAGIVGFRPESGDFESFGSGLSRTDGAVEVHAVLALSDGRLVVGGEFSHAGGLPCGNIAVWQAGAWSPLGAGTDGRVDALLSMPNGDVVAGGAFLQAGGQARNRLARWDGIAWSSIGSPFAFAFGSIDALLQSNGDLIVGGTFTSVGGTPANNIARWNGLAWSPLGSGTNGSVLALARDASGVTVAGGLFTSAGGVPTSAIARWDGSSWQALDSGMAGGLTQVRGLLPLPMGQLLAVGSFDSAGGLPTRNVARWDGSAWSGFAGGPDSTVNAAAGISGDAFYVGGAFATAGGGTTRGVARWATDQWQPLADGTSGAVLALATQADGALVAGGDFRRLEGQELAAIARHDGSGWAPIGTGMNGAVRALLAVPDQRLIAAGDFLLAGGTSARRIAAWDGAVWSALGGAADNGVTSTTGAARVHALARLANGDIIAGGSFTAAGATAAANVARWNGVSWAPLGGGCNGTVHALAVTLDGQLVVGGAFTMAGSVAASRIARWNGLAWSPLGPGLLTTVTALLVRSDGMLIANDRRWTGTNWVPLDGAIGGQVLALASLPDGSVVAARTSSSLSGASAEVRQWNGGAWTVLGPAFDEAVMSLRHVDGVGLVAGGRFTRCGAVVSHGLARYRAGCPAAVESAGAGCSSSAGPVQLTAGSWAWVGGSVRSTASGMPGSSLAVGVTGFQPAAVSLPTVLASGQIGCWLWADPARLDLLLPAGGLVQMDLSIAAEPALVGQQFVQQILSVELDAAGALLAVTTSNALRHTIGSY